MPIIAKESGTDFKPVSEGVKGARCFGVVDLGTQVPNNTTYRPSRRVLLFWEIPEEVYELDGKEFPMTIIKEYSLTLGKKNKQSNLRKDLNSWRGRAFTEEEAQGFDLKNIIGVPCMLSIEHYEKQGGSGKGAKVTAVTGLPKGFSVPELVHEKVYYELDMGKGQDFEALPEWVRTKINKCLEWNPSAAQAVAPPTGTEPEVEEPVDDVPFSFMIPSWLPYVAASSGALIS